MYANLARQVREHTVERARRARRQVLLLTPLIAAVVSAYSHRKELFGVDLPVRIVAVIAGTVLLSARPFRGARRPAAGVARGARGAGSATLMWT